MTIRDYLISIGCKKIGDHCGRDLNSYRKLIYSHEGILNTLLYSTVPLKSIENPSPKLLIKLYRLGMLTNV